MAKEKKSLFVYSTSDNLPFEINGISYYSSHYEINNYEDILFANFEIMNNLNSTQAVVKRRAEYLAGRICASRALNKLGLKKTNVTSNTDRSPSWPNGIVGSITHTNNFSAAIVARSESVIALGIDCENLLSVTDAMKIKNQIIHEDEKPEKYYVSLNINVFVTLVFSAKESLYKALYPHVNKFINFHDIIATDINYEKITLELKIKYGIWETGTKFNIYYKNFGYSILTLTCEKK